MKTTLLMTMALAIVVPSSAGLDAPLFASDDAIELTITADFSLLKDDRRESPERPATVTVTGEAGAIEAQVRTRGRFRLDKANCTFPPLKLNLKKKRFLSRICG